MKDVVHKQSLKTFVMYSSAMVIAQKAPKSVIEILW